MTKLISTLDTTLRHCEPDRLRNFVAAVYESAGVPAKDALFTADTLVQAELWGHSSHGLLRLEWYYTRLRSGAMLPLTHTAIVKDSGAIAVLEGADGIGQVIARTAIEEGTSRAQQHGVGVVSVRHSNHFGTCMYYTRMAASRGFIAMLMSNAGPNMPPWGGLKKMIGTNPWSIAVPGGKYGPVVMDMANSGVARGKIYLAQKHRETIPLDWAVDRHGRPTSDPQAALEGFILPMAGHKGYVIGVMIDILSGVLSGSRYLDGVHGPYDPDNRSGAGHFLLCLDVNAFQPQAEFVHNVEHYVERLKAVPVATGHEQIFYPGERENRSEREKIRTGIYLPGDTCESLIRVAQQAGIDHRPFF